MSNMSTTAKIAAIPAAAVGLLTMKYMIGHALTAMLWIAVIAGIIAVASAAKAKRTKTAAAEGQEREQVHPTVAWATIQQDAVRRAEALPPAQSQQVVGPYVTHKMHQMHHVN